MVHIYLVQDHASTRETIHRIDKEAAKVQRCIQITTQINTN